MKIKTHFGHTNRTVLKLSLIIPTLALALITQAAAPPAPAHPRYRLIDLGTFGGPFSTVGGESQSVNNHGIMVGAAETAIPDPFSPNCFSPNCVVQHAFQWKDGVLTDLGALPGGTGSYAIWVNERGDI